MKELSRRSVLTGAGLAAVAACERRAVEPPPRPRDPDAALRREVIVDIRRLLAQYAAVVQAHPSLASSLAPLMSDHRVHLQVLGAAAVPTLTPTPSGSTPPLGMETSRARLAQVEQESARRRVRQLATASPALARLLAAIGGSEAAHAVLLAGPP